MADERSASTSDVALAPVSAASRVLTFEAGGNIEKAVFASRFSSDKLLVCVCSVQIRGTRRVHIRGLSRLQRR